MSILKICKQANPIFNGRFHVPQINKRMGGVQFWKEGALNTKICRKETQDIKLVIVEQ